MASDSGFGTICSIIDLCFQLTNPSLYLPGLSFDWLIILIAAKMPFRTHIIIQIAFDTHRRIEW